MEWMVRRRGSRVVFKGGGRGSWACVPSVISAWIAAAILDRAGRIAQRPCAVPGSGGEASRRRETLRMLASGPAESGWSGATGQRGSGQSRAESSGARRKKGRWRKGADRWDRTVRERERADDARARGERLSGGSGLSARGGARAAEAAASWAERGAEEANRTRGADVGWPRGAQD